MKSHLHRLAPRPKGRLPISALILFLPLAGGCATVKPWQRETLSDPIMQPGRNPIAAAQLDHVYFSREAASGGTTVGGGGCGCN
jgi:hypothetical protein